MALHDELRALESAEEYLSYFGIPHDPERLKVVHLHFLKRFGEYKDAVDRCHGEEPETHLRGLYKEAAARAWDDLAVTHDPAYMVKSNGGCACAGSCGTIQQRPIEFNGLTLGRMTDA